MVVSKTTTTKRVYRLLLSFRLVTDDEVFAEQNGAGVVTSYNPFSYRFVFPPSSSVYSPPPFKRAEKPLKVGANGVGLGHPYARMCT